MRDLERLMSESEQACSRLEEGSLLQEAMDQRRVYNCYVRGLQQLRLHLARVEKEVRIVTQKFDFLSILDPR